MLVSPMCPAESATRWCTVKPPDPASLNQFLQLFECRSFEDIHALFHTRAIANFTRFQNNAFCFANCERESSFSRKKSRKVLSFVPVPAGLSKRSQKGEDLPAVFLCNDFPSK